jgi:hypothetical protein
MIQKIDLKYRPRKWQEEVAKELKRFSVLVVHRRGGKTVLAVMLLITAALRNTRDNGRYAYLAPLFKQAKAVAWDYLKAYSAKVPGSKVNESETFVEFSNGSRIRLFGADNPDALRGMGLDGVVLDEVADMKSSVWGEVILPCLSDWNGWALFIGTPRGLNLFSDLYYQALNDPTWYAKVYTINDTHALDQSQEDAMRKEMSANEWRQEMLCDFTAASDDTLTSIDLVEQAAGKHLREDQYDFSAKIIGVDVARYGGDRSVIFKRQGLSSDIHFQTTHIDNMTLAAKVAEVFNEWNADAIFVDAGRGEGVIDRLRQLGYSVQPVDFGGSPINPRYQNKRAEIWNLMKEWLEAGGAIPPDPALKRDLCTVTYSFANAAGKFSLESKDKMRDRGVASPDLADALACTFAFPVAPRATEMELEMQHHHAITEYDPFLDIGD